MTLLLGLILGIIASVIGAAIYGVFLSKNENKIWAYLGDARAGWKRRRYVRIFIQAIRGEARSSDSRTLGYLLMVYPAFFIMFGSFILGEHNSRVASLENEAKELQDLKEALQDLREEKIPPSTSIEEKIAIAETKVSAFLSSTKSYYPAIIFLVCVGYLSFFWMHGIRLPYVVFRSRFAHELDRFLMRIQGLASKSELAQLVKLEVKVRDEEIAICFVNMMASIARRHDVEELVDTFMLWGPLVPSGDSHDAATQAS